MNEADRRRVSAQTQPCAVQEALQSTSRIAEASRLSSRNGLTVSVPCRLYAVPLAAPRSTRPHCCEQPPSAVASRRALRCLTRAPTCCSQHCSNSAQSQSQSAYEQPPEAIAHLTFGDMSIRPNIAASVLCVGIGKTAACQRHRLASLLDTASRSARLSSCTRSPAIS